MKKFTFIILFLSVTLYGCENYSVKGSGKATELNMEEIKAFMEEKKTGFLYVKSALEVDKESDQMHLKNIKNVAKAEKVDFNVFDESELHASEFSEQDISKLTVKQYSGTFAFYLDGAMIEEIDLGDLSKEEIPSELEKFVRNAKEIYLK